MDKIDNQDEAMTHDEAMTPDEVGAMFDNPEVEKREDGYYLHFPFLEELLTNHFF